MTAETNITERNSNARLRGAREEVRESSVHSKKQLEPYRPRGAQDVPPQLLKQMSDQGYHLHWIRVLLNDEVDNKNIADAAYKGYEPVDISDIPVNVKNGMQFADVATFKGLIVSKDTALFKIPQERYEEIRSYHREIAEQQLRGVHDQIRQNASIHGIEVKLYDESESKIATGEKSRIVAIQADQKDD